MKNNRYSILLCILWAGISIFFPQVCVGREGKLQVTFIAISTTEEKFWGNIISMAQAAADDLNIDFEVLYAERDHIKAVELAREVSNRVKKPDYLIVVAEKRIGGKSLALAQKAGIDTMLFGDLTEREKRQFGRPRQQLSHWIGSRRMDDFGLGRETALAIINQGFYRKMTDNEGFLNIIALAGAEATVFSDGRVRGLLDALQDDRKTRLLQVVPTDWTAEEGYRVTKGLYHRYETRFGKKIGAIWAASSQLALGSIMATREMRLTAGEDFVVSGIDWEQEALEGVAGGDLLTVSGGHFAEVAWILVMLYDYHHGVDFIADDDTSGGSYSLNRENLAAYLQLFESGDWQQIDFTRFSRVFSPEIDAYNLNFGGIMAQFAEGSKTLR